LTDIGANLQLKLKGVPQKDPVFEGKPAGWYINNTQLSLEFILGKEKKIEIHSPSGPVNCSFPLPHLNITY